MTIKIYKPTKTAMQSGLGKTKKWLAEYISEVDNVKDSLMGWNSSLDTQSQIKIFLKRKNRQQLGQKTAIINFMLKNQKLKRLNPNLMPQTLILIAKSHGHIKIIHNYKFLV